MDSWWPHVLEGNKTVNPTKVIGWFSWSALGMVGGEQTLIDPSQYPHRWIVNLLCPHSIEAAWCVFVPFSAIFDSTCIWSHSNSSPHPFFFPFSYSHFTLRKSTRRVGQRLTIELEETKELNPSILKSKPIKIYRFHALAFLFAFSFSFSLINLY